MIVLELAAGADDERGARDAEQLARQLHRRVPTVAISTGREASSAGTASVRVRLRSVARDLPQGLTIDIRDGASLASLRLVQALCDALRAADPCPRFVVRQLARRLSAAPSRHFAECEVTYPRLEPCTAALGAGVAAFAHDWAPSQQSPTSAPTRPTLDIWHEVPLVPQLTGMSCWAAAAAMVIGWRDARPIGPEIVGGGCDGPAYQDGLLPNVVPTFARGWGLHAEPPRSYSTQTMAVLLARVGPLWLGEADPGLHVVVVAGMHGDTSPDGTWMHINDPWPIGRGERYRLTFRQLMKNYDAARRLGGPHVQVIHAGGHRSKGSPPRTGGFTSHRRG